MGLLSHRVERSEIKPGDHIYTWRASYAYSHHGIYVGGSKVVHFTRKKEAGTAGLDSAIAASSLLSRGSDECPTFPDCGFQLPDSGVILTCLDCFLRGGALHRFEYGAPAAVFLAKLRGGTCTTARPDPPGDAVHRAMHLLQNGFGDYDVFENNCEDFALYCKTGLLPAGDDEPGPGGIGRSGQAASAVGVPLAALFSTPFKLLAAGPLGMAAVTAGMYCAGRYITDIGVRKDVVKVEVENLSEHLGFRRATAEESAKKLPEKAKRLLPLKRKRER
ncbi:protein LEAD-SENSITIVE 1-like [Phragmites australis]|uniref:protein LEAD-SENSITIVE 1-like n=1 Tax=Phragmites australis TaxID=29695 RepID=UPI002D794F09|nr:protein LEAD-SENSITIVE 1-like [Phragmites australis]